MQKLYFRFKGTENIHAFMCRNEHERGTIVSLSGCDLELTYRPKGNERPGCAGMIIEENESEFWDFFSCLDSSSKELKYEKIL